MHKIWFQLQLDLEYIINMLFNKFLNLSTIILLSSKSKIPVNIRYIGSFLKP